MKRQNIRRSPWLSAGSVVTCGTPTGRGASHEGGVDDEAPELRVLEEHPPMLGA